MQTTVLVAPLGLLIVVAVIVGLVMLVRALPPGSGPKVALGAAGLLALVMFALFFVKSHQLVPQHAAVRQELPTNRQDNRYDGLIRPRAAGSSLTLEAQKEPEAESPTKSETGGKNPDKKPAWLIDGLQTVNGVTKFPVSSELFATVAECQKDLDRRLPQVLSEEVTRLANESMSLPLFPDDVQRMRSETFTEEVPTSQGTWYKVHQLVKIDENSWGVIYNRFHHAKIQTRLEKLAMGFAGLMLVFGVVYLVLRRRPRNVDPTLETFSTT